MTSSGAATGLIFSSILSAVNTAQAEQQIVNHQVKTQYNLVVKYADGQGISKDADLAEMAKG